MIYMHYTQIMDPIRNELLNALQAEHMCQQSLAKEIAATPDNDKLIAMFDKQAKYIAMLEQIYEIYDTFMRENDDTQGDLKKKIEID
jgi:hypothetical protein